MISWAPQALKDLNEIVAYLEQFDEEVADAVESAILQQIEWLEQHSMAGSRVEGMPLDYKLGYAIKQKFKIYYRVKGVASIKVIMIRRSERLPPKPKDITKRDLT